MSFVLFHKLLIDYINWLDVLNSNKKRTGGTNLENWQPVHVTSNSSYYLEVEEKTTIPNTIKDDLYVRKLSPILPTSGNAFDQFLPKCWISEDVNWKRIKRETYKPWYKEFQGFRFVFVHVSIILAFLQHPDPVHFLCCAFMHKTKINFSLQHL